MLVWTFKANYTNTSDRIIVTFLLVGLVPILFADYTVQARILYMIPFQIPASIILYRAYRSPKWIIGSPYSLPCC